MFQIVDSSIQRIISRFVARSNFSVQFQPCLPKPLASCHRTDTSPYCTSSNTAGTGADNVENLCGQLRYLKRRDERKQHPPDVSIRYMESEAYKDVYGEEPVWVPYRRNFKGQYAPRKTRKTCVREGKISTGNPCPICRDEYLTVHYTNVKLLKQFVSPYTDKILEATKTGVCRKQHMNLCVAVEKATDEGLITFQVPFRYFDYKEFYPWVKPKNERESIETNATDKNQ